MPMSRTTKRSFRRTGGVVLLTVAMLAGACTKDDDASVDGAPGGSVVGRSASGEEATSTTLPPVVQELEIDGTEYAFQITPDPASGLVEGWTLIRFRNLGAEPHQVMFARIKDGVDMSELAAAGAGDSSGAGAIEFVDMIGGVSYIGQGRETTALVNLTEGTVMAMCYVPDGAGVAHALMGMSTALPVSAPTDDPPQVQVPDGDEVVGTIELAADGYQLPTAMRSGWYHVVNTDSALHELSLLRLADPIDEPSTAQLVDDLAANRTPDVELEAMGGMGAISSGFDGYLYLDLSAGDYLALDFMPDPGNPRPHMLDGYHGTFTVGSDG